MSTTRHRLTTGPLALLAGFAVFIIYSLRYVLIPFAVAGGLAYLLTPAVGCLQKRARVPRAAAAVAIYFVAAGLLAAFAWGNGSRMYDNARQLFSGGPPQLHDFIARLMGGEHLSFFGRQVSADDLAARAQEAVNNVFLNDSLARAAGLAAGVTAGAVLFLVLLFYFLLQGPRLARGALNLAPPEHRPALRAFAERAHPLMLRYVSGLAVIVLFAMVAVWAGVGPIFHLPHPVLLAMTAGLLELLPVAGPTVSAFLLFGAAAAHGETGWTFAGFAACFIALRLCIDQVVGTIVLGRAVRLPPVVVIFAFVAGGVLLGPLGVLLAIPGAALLRLALDSYYALPVDPL